MSRKQVTFNEDEKEDKEIKILKVEYIWQNNLDEFHSRNKILKIAGKRVSIPMTSTNYKDDEYILNPKFITINPFKSDDSLLVLCNITNMKSEDITYEKRLMLIDTLDRIKRKIEENKPRIAFKIKIKITFLNEQDKYSTISSLISLLLKARINISEYYLEDEYLYIENEFIDPLKCAEEFTTLRYILQMSKNLVSFHYLIDEKITLKLLDKNTCVDKGVVRLRNYCTLLGDSLIPSSTENMQKGYLIKSLNYINKCMYEYISISLDKIYNNITKDI